MTEETNITPVVSKRYNVFFHQMTSSRTVRAVVVGLFACVMTYLIAVEQSVPDALSAPMLIMIGYYFGEDQNQPDTVYRDAAKFDKR